MVIVVLSILGAVALPVFVDLRQEARNNKEIAEAGAIRQGILNYFLDPARGNRSNYPPQLDSVPINTACGPLFPCFNVVLTQGISTDYFEQWYKTTTVNTYRSYASNTNSWTYNPVTGDFIKVQN